MPTRRSASHASHGPLRWGGLPAAPGALLVYLLSRGAVALMMGLPVSAAVAQAVGEHPRGDGLLWDAGGVWLFEVLRLVEPAAASLGWSTAAVGLAGSFALLVPLAVLIASLRLPADRGRAPARSARQLFALAAERFGALALLMGVISMLQALAFALWAMLASTLLRSVELLPQTRDVAWLATLTAGALIPWLLGVAHDVARVGTVRWGLGLLDALELALRGLTRLGRTMVFAAGWRGLSSGGCLLAAAWAGLLIDCRAPARLLAVAAIQALALCAAVLLRASWLRWIGRRIGRGAEIALPAAGQLHYMVVRSSTATTATERSPR